MIRSKERIDYEHDIKEIEYVVTKAIDDLSEKLGHNFHYGQINSALVNVLSNNLSRVRNFDIAYLEEEVKKENIEEYPEATCMDCGEICETWEEVEVGDGDEIYSHIELWNYCPKCGVETFHQIPRSVNPEIY